MTKQINTDSFEKVIQLLDNGENIFITGGGGVGKSFLLNNLKKHYKDDLSLTSTTGISAINIGGQTLHSWAGIGIADKPVNDTVKKIKNRSSLFKQLNKCKKLAIDEISMLDNLTMDYVNEVLKQVRGTDRPFGGIQIILVGDFFQLPPVKIDQIEEKDFCFNSSAWKELNLTTVFLQTVYRQSDKNFIEALNNVRINKTAARDLEVFYNRSFSYDYEPDKDILQIFGTNRDADNYNEKCFNELKSKAYTYKSKDTLYQYSLTDDTCTAIDLKDDEASNLNQYDAKCIEQFNKDCKAPRNLELKEGCRVILLKNIDISNGLVNGSCGTVKKLAPSSIYVLFDNGQSIHLEPEEFEYSTEGKPKIIRNQYPLRLAYGITIHKSQGMTFDKLVVNFSKIFDYGQAYVALSRATNLNGLIIKGFNHHKIIANKKVVNFYKNLKSDKKCILI